MNLGLEDPLEVAGEELESVSGPVRLVCNSVIDARDVTTAKRAAQAAMRREWCEAEPEKLPESAKARFQRLHDFLVSGKLQVKVLPDEKFGLIHGKAGEAPLPTEEIDMWGWMRNPLPPAVEGPDYSTLRRSLGVTDADAVAPGGSFDLLRPPDRARVRRLFPRFVEEANPFIRHIVLRTREYLETTMDPETGEPFLKPVNVRLHGERDEDAIQLPPFLEDASHLAEEFCRLLAQRAKSGFFRTLLLRRVGSTMEAGRQTVEKMLAEWASLDDDDDDEESLSQLRTLTNEERAVLQRFLRTLEANHERDPKYHIVREQLLEHGWLDLGCIIFSQYFDSVYWLAEQLTQELSTEEIGIYAGAQRRYNCHPRSFHPASSASRIPV